ncbi:hypothetical protein E6P97_02055 [Patescibacteria group bacterium]|nr:MAG: hypothetical protein E6P97_02055 [Patescibacteria group bacterium]
MLKLSSNLLNQPVLSLRSGGTISTVVGVLINPNNLSVVALYCARSPRDKETLVLLPQDIREWISQGFVVNDHDSLSASNDLVRLKDVMKIDYQLIGKPVHTKGKRRVGRVSDFAVDDGDFTIQKLYVSQNVMKNLSGTGLAVDRNQVIELNDKRIIIRDPLQGVPHTAPALA